MTAPRFTLQLAKSDFKFAAAHFTWFADGSAERLHGHNYRVSARIAGPRVGADDMLVEARVVKDEVRKLCAALDERVLLPRAGERVAIEEHGDDTNVRVAGRRYRLPASDVVRLPVGNITVEALAAYFWRALAPTLSGLGIDSLCVEIAESEGQSASYEAAL
jgi:6-pyruvoyltetrahydropterin/6-carboxytetrahydropterin synthase